VPHGPSGAAGIAVNSRYIYWTDEKGNEIGRANLDGTGVNQKFITGAHFPDSIAAGPQYLYWTNQNSHAIGRAKLNGTEVNQRFLARKDFLNLHGVAVQPGR
jgi:virginiamycin B lyase